MKKLLLYILLPFALSFIGCKDDRNAASLIERAELLLSSNPDSSRILLDSIVVPDNLRDKNLAHWCMLYSKVADTLHIDLPYALQLQRALKYYKAHGTLSEQAQIALYLGREQVAEKEFENAMATYLSALDMALEGRDSNLAGYISSYTADLYDLKESYMLAKNKYEEGAHYFKDAGNLRSYAFALRDMGCMYAFADSLELALTCIHKADTIAMVLGDSIAIGSVNNGLGNVYGMMGQLELAEEYMLKAMRFDTSDLAPDYLALSGFYMEEGNNEKAREYLHKADIPTLNESTPVDILYRYYLVEKDSKCPEKALEYLEQYNQKKDSIENLLEKENIFRIEKEYDYLKISLDNVNLRSDRQWMFILCMVLIVFFLCLVFFYYIRMSKKDAELYKQELDIKEKDIVLLHLKEELQVKQKDLNVAFEKMKSFQYSNKQYDIELEYIQKQKEIEIVTKKIGKQQQELLFCSSIGKKIIKYSTVVNPGQKKSPLTEKDWEALFSKANEIYPSLRNLLIETNMTDAEQHYSYLSLFKLDTKGEAVLLNINPDSVNKRRQRVRQKLGIIGLNEELGSYLVSVV